MGEIGKRMQLNEKEWYRAVRDLGFYEMRWILKFSFKLRLTNEIEILKIWLKQYYNDISLTLINIIKA